MNNNFFKKIIFILIMLLAIILIVIMTIIRNNKKYRENFNGLTETGDDVVTNYGAINDNGIDEQAYFDIKKCIQQYLNYINMNNPQNFAYDEQGNYVCYVEENDIKLKIYNVLSKKYINENNITIENLYDHVKVLNDLSIFVPLEMKLVKNGDIKTFLVSGLANSIDYVVMDKIFLVVNLDIVNGCYSIEPLYNDYSNIEEIVITEFEDSIEPNSDNQFSMSIIDRESVPKEYILAFKRLALSAPEEIYKSLDEEYRNAKFGDLEGFKKYIEENKTKIMSAKLDKYKKEFELEKTRYILIDQYERYYIIDEKAPIQDYTLMLDTYTVNLPEFIEKYDLSEYNIKVALNIEKLVEATKNGDYKYVYSKLDDTFKSSNFKTQEDFEKYIKEIYNPKDDKIEYEEYDTITGLHIYNIEITNNENTKRAKIVMKLQGEKERDFVVSFSKIEN